MDQPDDDPYLPYDPPFDLHRYMPWHWRPTVWAGVILLGLLASITATAMILFHLAERRVIVPVPPPPERPIESSAPSAPEN